MNPDLIAEVDAELRPAHISNQSVENAGVAFVKGADKRNKFFEKNKPISNV